MLPSTLLLLGSPVYLPEKFHNHVQTKQKNPGMTTYHQKNAGFPGILLSFFSHQGGEALTAHTTGNKVVFL